tara:strand:+ start:326 stop:502 length:177 start_codon:yes stop_codon:yes gene_type:complete
LCEFKIPSQYILEIDKIKLYKMFDITEVEKMFFDPIDLAVSATNNYLSKFKFINFIFS